MALFHPNRTICLQASFLQLGHKHKPGTICCHGIFLAGHPLLQNFCFPTGGGKLFIPSHPIYFLGIQTKPSALHLGTA